MRAILCVLACVLLVAPTFGCQYSEVRVTVPHGYRGTVFLSCRAESNANTSATVDDLGSGSLETCPTRRSHVYVIQDGHATVVDDVQWNKAGDGVLTGIRFSVH